MKTKNVFNSRRLSRVGRYAGIPEQPQSDGSAIPFAHIERVSPYFVGGWIRGGSVGEAPRDAIAIINGKNIGLVKLNRPRDDVLHSGLAFEFEVSIPEPVADGLLSANEGLHFELRSKDSGELLAQTFVPPNELPYDLIGRIEVAQVGIVSGWIRPTKGSGRGCFAISVDGKVVHRGFAAVSRPDLPLREAELGGSAYGFEAPIPPILPAERSQRIVLLDDRGVALDTAWISVGAPSRAGSESSGRNPPHQGLNLLRTVKHDANPEWALLRNPESDWPIRTQLRVGEPSSERVTDTGRRLWELEPESDVRSTRRPLYLDWVACRFGEEVLPHQSLHSGLAVAATDTLAAMIVAKERNVVLPLDGIEDALLQEAWERGSGLPGPPLSRLQVAYWRSMCVDVSIADETGIADLLTRWVVWLRDFRGGLQLVSSEQMAWLRMPSGEGMMYDHRLSRYELARWRMVETWRDAFELEFQSSVAGLLCDLAFDEMVNGFGTALLSSTTVELTYGKSDPRFRPDEAGLLSQIVWLAGRSVNWSAYELDVRQADDFASWLVTLQSGHPLLAPWNRPMDWRARTIDNAVTTSGHEQRLIDVVGLLGHPSGVGTNADNSYRALRMKGLNVRGIPLDFRRSPVGAELDFCSVELATTAILHIQPDYIPEFFAVGLNSVSGVQRAIGFFAWETERLPRVLRLACDFVDEIWVPSEFCAESFREATTRPVRVAHHAVERADGRALSRADLGIDGGHFVVHVAIDAHSSLSRKNPIASIDAFRRAFGSDRDCRLLLKVRNWSHVVARGRSGDRTARALLAAIAHESRVVLVVDELTPSEVQSLCLISDCYLSLHRSEGFGYGIAEAMMLGTPVVATGYSGNVDFMSEANSFPVEYQMTPIRSGDYPYVNESFSWAEPNMDSAVDALTALRSGWPGVEERLASARSEILTNYSIQAMANRYWKLLS